jgi:hypothetical protein
MRTAGAVCDRSRADGRRQRKSKTKTVFRTGEKENTMKFKHSIVLVSILALGAIGSAQDVASDVDRAAKDTGRVTEKAAKETGRRVKDGVKGVDKGTKDAGRATEKGGKKTGRVITKGAEDVGHGVKEGTEKTADALK